MMYIKTLCKTLLFISLFVLSESVESFATVFVQDNFDNWPDYCAEELPPAPWCQDCGSTGAAPSTEGEETHCAAEVDSPGRGGVGKSFKVWRYGNLWPNYNGSVSLRQSAIPEGVQVMYIRWYMKVPASMNMTGFFQKMFRYNISGGNEMYVDNYYGNMRYCPNGSGNDCFAQNLVSTAAWQDNEWHCHEFMFDIANSTVRYWLDGTQTYSKTNIDMAGMPTSATYGYSTNFMQHFPIGNRTVDSSYPSSWYALEVDDVVFANEYIGPEGEIATSTILGSGSFSIH